MIDDLHDTDSGLITDHPVWPRSYSLAAWRMYLDGTPGLDASPYAVASRATDLGRLPPAFILVGEVDLFLDESADYAERLIQSGTRAEFKSYSSVFHGVEVAGAGTIVGMQMIDDFVAALARAFA